MTTREGGSIADPEVLPGLKRQIPNDLEYLTRLRANWVKNLASQIVLPNKWLYQKNPDLSDVPLSSTAHANSYSRTINQSHAFREKQLFYGN